MKLKGCGFFTVGLAILLAACGKSPESGGAPATTTAASTGAAAGTASTATAPLPRIASKVPAATLNLVLIGADKRLVGVSSFDATLILPAEERNLPVIGDYEQTNYEQLVKIAPTVLIVHALTIEPRLQEFVDAHHIQLLNMKFDHVADIWTSVRALGKAAGYEAEAERAIKQAQQELADVTVDFKDAPHPKVLYIADTGDNTACGAGNLMDEMITAAGGENVVKARGYVRLGREAMVKLAPDVLLIGAPDSIPELEDDPRLRTWRDLPVPAARNHRLYLITDGNSQMPSVAIGKNVRALAELIHRGSGGSAGVPAPGAGDAGGGK